MIHRRSISKNMPPSLSRYYREDLNNEQYLNENLQYLKYRMSLVQNDSVNIAFITDIHLANTSSFDMWLNYDYYKPSNWSYHNGQNYNHDQSSDKLERALHTLTVLSKQKKIDCVILGGDYLQQYVRQDGTSSLSKMAVDNLFNRLYGSVSRLAQGVPVFILRGNHDSNSFGSSLNDISNIADFSVMQKSLPDYSNCVYGNENRDYGYYDIEHAKTRIIWLNSWDFDITSSNQLSNQGPYYRLAQLEFIINNALDFKNKSGWKILVFSHHSLADSCGFGAGTGMTEAIQKIFISFRHKLSGSYVYNSSNNDFSINVSWDFSNNLSNTYIAAIHGHTHNSTRLNRAYNISNGNIIFDASTYYNGVSYIQENALNSPNVNYIRNDHRKCAQGWLDNITDPSKDKATYAPFYVGRREAAFNIIQYDLTNSYIYCQRYGYGTSKVYEPANTGSYVYKYKNFEVIVNDGSNPILGAKVSLIYNGEDIYQNPYDSGNGWVAGSDASTDNNGSFTFERVPIDKCNIKVTAEGYQDHIEPISNINLTSKTITLTRNE